MNRVSSGGQQLYRGAIRSPVPNGVDSSLPNWDNRRWVMSGCKTDFSLKDTWDSLSFAGTWKLFMRHWKFGLDECKRAFCRRLFLRQLQRLIPSLQNEDIIYCKAGMRAQVVGSDGFLIDDFRIERQDNSIHILNAPSPAATAALAIGDYVNQIATDYFKL